MNILFITTGISYGGAYKIFVWLMNQLVTKGHRVSLLTYRTDKTIAYQHIDTHVIRVHLPLESKGGSITQCAKSIITLHRHIKKEGYDLGIAFLPPAQIRLILACKGTKTKSLISQRGDPSSSILTKSSYIPQILIQKILALSDGFVFQTRCAMKHYPESVQRKSIIIPNPIIPLHRTLKRLPEKRIVNVARLEIRQKRQDVLINAFNLLTVHHPDYILELYGNGKDESYLRNLAKENKNIKFMGVTNDIVSSIQNAAMFVLSSDFEGIPNALLEAMSLGIPCITTNYSPGGANLIISNRENGLIVERNDVDSLAKKMEEFIDNASFSERCGKMGHKTVINLNDKAIIEKWIKYMNKTTS